MAKCVLTCERMVSFIVVVNPLLMSCEYLESLVVLLHVVKLVVLHTGGNTDSLLLQVHSRNMTAVIFPRLSVARFFWQIVKTHRPEPSTT